MGTGLPTRGRTRTRRTPRGAGGRTASKPDPGTAHLVAWMFVQRLAGHSAARIARALNDAGIPCPSAADRGGTRTAPGRHGPSAPIILANPRYTGRQVWNRQRTDAELADPANTSLGHKSVQRWNLPDGWVISARPAHPALVSEADFIAAQDISAARGPAPHAAPAAPGNRRYLLAGLLACGACGRRMESAWSNGKPAYRCRHGHTSAAPPDPGRPKNAYIREDRILPHLPALHLLLTGTEPATRRRRTRRGADARLQAGAEDVIGYVRDRGITLTYDPAAGPCRQAPAKPPRPSSGKQANPGSQSPAPEGRKENRRSPGTGASPRPGDVPPCRKTAGHGNYCVRGSTPYPHIALCATALKSIYSRRTGRMCSDVRKRCLPPRPAAGPE